MTNQTLSQLLISFILILSCLRVFFPSRERQESIAILPVIAFILSILEILAWGANIIEIIIFALSVSVLLINIRALFRLAENLIVDHYSGLFITGNIIFLILSVLVAATSIYFSPIKTNLTKYNVKHTTVYYTGSENTSFKVCVGPNDKRNLALHCYKPNSTVQKEVGNTVIFIPSECAFTRTYEPFFAKLAKEGYCVYSADFLNIKQRTPLYYAKERAKNSEEYKAFVENEKTDIFINRYKALSTIIEDIAGTEQICVGDDLPKDVYISLLREENHIKRCFDIANIGEYNTKGFGFVEQTEPLTAVLLGYKKDASSYASNKTATILDSMIKSAEEKPTTKTIVIED